MENETLQNQQVNIDNNITINNDRLVKFNINDIKIDVSQYIYHFTRRVKKSLHYSKDCYTILGAKEFANMQKIILFLYEEQFKKNKEKITMTDLAMGMEAIGMAQPILRASLYKLIPVAISLKSYQKQHISRYFKLTDAGKIIAEKLIMEFSNEPIQNNNQ